MRIALTGGTGFIGGALVRRLLTEKHSVRALARASRRADELAERGVEVVRGDLSDEAAIERTAEGAEIFYHLGAQVAGGGSEKEYMEANEGGTQRVLKGCVRQGVQRVIYHSSLAVYGTGYGTARIDEGTAFDAKGELRGYYALSKIAADRAAVSFARKNGLSLVLFRPGLVYGPGRIPLGLLAFAMGKSRFVFGRPGMHVPLNYVENLLDAMEMAARMESSGSEEFNIVDDEDSTLGDYHRALKEAAGGRTFFLPGWPVEFSAPGVDAVTRALGLMGDSRFSRHQVRRMLEDRFYSTERVRKRLGWSARVPMREAIRHSIEAKKQQ
jgi:nucleoside-diphosphate-sugar epimerase